MTLALFFTCALTPLCFEALRNVRSAGAAQPLQVCGQLTANVVRPAFGHDVVVGVSAPSSVGQHVTTPVGEETTPALHDLRLSRCLIELLMRVRDQVEEHLVGI